MRDPVESRKKRITPSAASRVFWGIQPAGEPRIGNVRYWLGIAATLVSLSLLLSGADPSRVGDLLVAVDYRLAIVCVVTVALTIVLKGVRWKILFQPPPAQPSTSRAISILTIGQMVNFIFPLRFGEVSRVYLACDLGGSPASLVVATIVLEKTIDSLMLLVCAALLMPFVRFPAWLREPLLGAAAVAMVAIALVLTLGRWRHLANIVLRTVLSLLSPRVGGFVARHAVVATEGLASLWRSRVLTQVLVLSVAIWVLAVLTNYTAFLSLAVPAPFVAAIFLLVVLQVGVAIPSAPGRVGVFQAITALGLSPFAIDPSVALTYGIFLHLVVFLPPSVAGIVLLLHANVTIREQRSRVSNPE